MTEQDQKRLLEDFKRGDLSAGLKVLRTARRSGDKDSINKVFFALQNLESHLRDFTYLAGLIANGVKGKTETPNERISKIFRDMEIDFAR